MDRYSHTYRPALSQALNVLPDLSGRGVGRTVAVATGTDGGRETPLNVPPENLARFLALFGQKHDNQRQQGSTNDRPEKTQKPLKNQGFSSGGGGIRTPRDP